VKLEGAQLTLGKKFFGEETDKRSPFNGRILQVDMNTVYVVGGCASDFSISRSTHKIDL